ncbi:hypothetical protein [Thermosipho atlanticus]|uniref:DUF4129 domain-containing protein n=1 Tax=Thermosipho atlanticus DSM 15807 TaxID=1123380 RepID=A0A1M5TJC6_9BACT|nr:hypothetical protein [Thermosipho atlanticus]SHH50799.1 hypothetical protein SAMN02745199_1345 [Thermosipho atlanticus DSM 15807]
MLIDILILSEFFAAFLNIDLYFLIFLALTFFAFQFKSLKWLYFVVFFGMLFVLRNPIPVILVYTYEKTKKSKQELYTFLLYFLIVAFFYELKTLLISLFLIFLVALKEKKFYYLLLIPLLFIPVTLSPYQKVSNFNVKANMQMEQPKSSYETPANTYTSQSIEQNTSTEISVSNLEIKKYDKVIFPLLMIIGAFSVLILIKFTNKPTIRIVLGIIAVVSFAYFLFLVLFPYLGRNTTLRENLTIGNQATGNIETLPTPLSTPTLSNSKVENLRKTINIVNFTIIFIAILASLILAIVVYLIWDVKKEKVLKKTSERDKEWETTDTYEVILNLDSGDLIKRVYFYIRAKIFPGYYYLTPYELSNLINDNKLSYITQLFVKSEYGGKLIKYDEEKVKAFFKEIVEKYT